MSSAPTAVVLVNLSGRGDKDVETAARWFGIEDPLRHRRDGESGLTSTPPTSAHRGAFGPLRADAY